MPLKIRLGPKDDRMLVVPKLLWVWGLGCLWYLSPLIWVCRLQKCVCVCVCVSACKRYTYVCESVDA